MKDKIKVIHIITGLSNGGAEMMLYKVLQNIDRERFDVEVISMLDEGVMGQRINELGIRVHCLNMNKGRLLSAFFKAKRICCEFEVIQCWMYHANLLGLLLRGGNGRKLIWGIRRGELDKRKDKKSIFAIAKICALFSDRADRIIYCAGNSMAYHQNTLGYKKNRAAVIPNGFDLARFYKKDVKQLRNELLGTEPGARLICFIGRWDKVKGFENFIMACGMIRRTDSEFRLVMAGTNVDEQNDALTNLIIENGMNGAVIRLGRRDDVADIMSACDLLVSASYTEAFSNVIGEAMACELPCVVTNVGDSAFIVGDTGIVAENNDPVILSDAIRTMLSLSGEERQARGKAARQRVCDLFEIGNITRQYEKTYLELMNR